VRQGFKLDSTDESIPGLDLFIKVQLERALGAAQYCCGVWHPETLLLSTKTDYMQGQASTWVKNERGNTISMELILTN
jgi:hypothetical protein